MTSLPGMPVIDSDELPPLQILQKVELDRVSDCDLPCKVFDLEPGAVAVVFDPIDGGVKRFDRGDPMDRGSRYRVVLYPAKSGSLFAARVVCAAIDADPELRVRPRRVTRYRLFGTDCVGAAAVVAPLPAEG